MKLLAITSCPTGIAHTYMAAEALQIAAKEMGHEIKVETQGSVGAENVVTEDEIKAAKSIIIAADTNVDKSRFVGKIVIEVPVKDAIKDPKGLINKAVNAKSKSSSNLMEQVSKIRAKENEKITGIYKHLMTGISYMIPFVVAGGLLIAIGFSIGGTNVSNSPNSFGGTIFWTGKAAFSLMIPILGGYIAYSIADRPGIVPGMVGGYLAFINGSSFIGALVAGFLAGYLVLFIKKYIKLPKPLEGLMPVLVIPLLSTVVIGLLMGIVIGQPVAFINKSLIWWLTGLKGVNAALFGIILGAFIAFDMGGPLNKATYVFATATLGVAGYTSTIMAAVMAAGMVPPLGLALATVIAKKKFTVAEREAGKIAWALGISFVTEGAIPFAARDPLRVIPSIMIGSSVTGALSMLFGCGLAVPHGGIFVLFIPNVVTNVVQYIISIVAGMLVSALLVTAMKKPI